MANFLFGAATAIAVEFILIIFVCILGGTKR